MLRSSDLPASWTATRAPADTSDSQANAELAKCVGARDTSADGLAEVQSDNFSVQGFTVSSSATLFKSKADIDSDTAQLKRPKMASCLKTLVVKQLKASLPADRKLGTVSVVVQVGSHGAASNVMGTLRAQIALKVQSQQTTVYLDSVYIAGPLTEAEVDYEGVGVPVPATIQAELTALTAQRCAR